MTVLLQFVSGAVGGNVSGFLLRARSRGTLMNTLLGGIGGVGGGTLLGPTMGTSSMVNSILGSGRTATIVTALIIGAVIPLIAAMVTKKKV